MTAPPGYTHLRAAGADAVCLAELAPALAAVLAEHGTLYAYAAAHPARVTMQGRAPAYAVPLPEDGGDVVVRHAWHGGALRHLTRDLFAPPTRAARELVTSERLRAAGVRPPRVVAYARYPAPLGLWRVDVATALVPGARDLAAALAADPRAEWVEPTAALLGALARTGARHPDLNLKNVLLAPDPAGGTRAWALDVDVARVPARAAAGREQRAALLANHARLRRSLDKWRRTRALPVTDADLARLRDRAQAHLAAPRPGAA